MLGGVDRDLVIAKLQQMQEWLLVAYAVSLPLSMTLSWGLLTAGLIAWAVESIVRKFIRARHEHAVFVSTPLPLSVPLAALAIAVTLSGLLNPGDKGLLLEAWRSLWSLKGLLIYFWASKIFHFRPSAARLAFPLLLCISAVAGVWGMIQYSFHLHHYFLQGTGFLAGPMPFAGQMQLFGLLSLALLLSGAYRSFFGKLHNKVLFAVIVVANLLGLVFAGERSAWLGGLAGVVTIAAMASWKVFFRTLLVLMVVAVVSFNTVPLIKDRVQSTFSPQQDVSTNARFIMWKEAIRLWNTSPVFGVGYLHFTRMELPQATGHEKNKDLNHAHSNYLQFLATTGIIGFLAYLWLCVTVIVKGLRAFARAKTEKDSVAAGFYCGAIAGMVSLMVSGLFEYNFGTAQVRLAQWLVMALLSYELVKSPHEEERGGPKGTIPDSLPNV